MNDESIEFMSELGTQLGHLIKLCRDLSDPRSILLCEEIDQLSRDHAQALLAAAVIVLAQKQTNP